MNIKELENILSKKSIDWIKDNQDLYCATLEGRIYFITQIEMLLEARRQGENEVSIKIAKNLLEEEYPIDVISKMTKLSVEQIENIKHQI